MKEIKFVDVGEGITEGQIVKWLVKDKDNVKEDQAVAQVETDKAVVNVPAPIAGIIKIDMPEKSVLHLGNTLAHIGTQQEISTLESSGNIPKQEMQAGQTVNKGEKYLHEISENPEIESMEGKHEILAAPSVRKLARDMNVDLSKVKGTGPAGRILENDIRNFVGTSGTSPAAKPVSEKALPNFSGALEMQHAGEIERIPLSQTRRAIARNMEASATIPRAAHMDLVDASALYALVSKEKQEMEKDMSIKLTFMPFVIKAVIEALKENPNFNASYDSERLEIIKKNYYNIGIAAEAKDGLKVIVVKNADKKTIAALAKELQELRKKLDSNTITLDEMKDSTFTITNIGSLGGGFLSVPMINYPDVAILGIHLIRDWPIVENGEVKVGKILPISLAFDHRVVDGAEAVKFGNAFKKYIEDPEFLEMLG